MSNEYVVFFYFKDYDFHVRWPSVKLLTTLLSNRQKDMQEIILVIPMGVSHLMDLLSDSREIIRNDVSFCKNNSLNFIIINLWYLVNN